MNSFGPNWIFQCGVEPLHLLQGLIQTSTRHVQMRRSGESFRQDVEQTGGREVTDDWTGGENRGGGGGWLVSES